MSRNNDGHLGYPIYEKTEIFVHNNWRNIPAKAKSALEWSHVFRAIPISNTSPYYGLSCRGGYLGFQYIL
jgi:hypothetical protein